MNQLTPRASKNGAEPPISRAPATALNMNDVFDPETERTLFVQLHIILSSTTRSDTGFLGLNAHCGRSVDT